jgi:hypothetical protein
MRDPAEAENPGTTSRWLPDTYTPGNCNAGKVVHPGYVCHHRAPPHLLPRPDTSTCFGHLEQQSDVLVHPAIVSIGVDVFVFWSFAHCVLQFSQCAPTLLDIRLHVAPGGDRPLLPFTGG